ncbi:MAG: patatin-like protein [Kiloniellales bacterium]
MKEVRIGVVLFGGVSLAVYMNGITTELWHLLRASPRQGASSSSLPQALDGNAVIYADLLAELAAKSGVDLRIVVDAVAGSSAGGLNGTALAKAVVEGGSVEPLEDTWIEEADIAVLLPETNERPPFFYRRLIACLCRRYDVLKDLKERLVKHDNKKLWDRLCVSLLAYAKGKEGQHSVLNASAFTKSIAGALKRMDGKKGPPLVSQVAGFDLFLTMTDLGGWPRHLPVSARYHPHPLYERSHAHVMHFRTAFGNGPFNEDFALTFASRSTAGFPFAFAPLNNAQARQDFSSSGSAAPMPSPDNFAHSHLRQQQLCGRNVDDTFMIDGGLLDNKPFTYVAAAIERKPAEVEVHRVVIYVEPDPEKDPIAASLTEIPGAKDLAKRLYGLLRHEPIYGDLVRLEERNHEVRRIRRVLDANREAVLHSAQASARRAGLAWPPQRRDAAGWRKAANAHAALEALSGYPGYVALKAEIAGKLVAELVCRCLNFPPRTRQAYLIRQVVKVWLRLDPTRLAPPRYQGAQGFQLKPKQLELLEAFDISFRLRRLRRLVRAVNGLYDGLASHPQDLRQELDRFKSALAASVIALESALENVADLCAELLKAFGEGILRQDIEKAIEDNTFDPETVAQNHSEALGRAYTVLGAKLKGIGEEQNRALIGALEALPESAAQSVLTAFASFPFEDISAYPLMLANQVEDLIEVDVMRISPLDSEAANGDQAPLQSLEFGAFAGFLDRTARVHDITRGRIDGATRILDLLLDAAFGVQKSGPAASALRKTYDTRLRTAIELAMKQKS